LARKHIYQYEAQPEQTEPLDLSKVGEKQKGPFGSSVLKESEEEVANLRILSIQEENEKKKLNYDEREEKQNTAVKMYSCLESGKILKTLKCLKSHSKVHMTRNSIFVTDAESISFDYHICYPICILTPERSRSFVKYAE
uniref:C2H2-type domain-containing protein n=1 Tax=Onchocerca flexuosa TaxID=387005 RepID=A0A183HXT5_9BILA